MKKLLTIVSLAIATISFAKNSDVKNEPNIKNLKEVKAKVSFPETQYSVTFALPCGGHMITAYFDSPFSGMAFAAHLAFVIESAVQEGCKKVAQISQDLGA